MAKGNDGNYLQHSVEVAAANHLKEMNPEGLHVAFTHGMKPFEPFETMEPRKSRGLVRCRLKAAISCAGEPWREGEPGIVTVYRRTSASERHYPNSAELMRAIWCGERSTRLTGGIAEVFPDKHQALADAWRGFSMRTRCTSWRKEVGEGGVLTCPKNLQVPWLFSMDPMTYKSDGHDDDDLNEPDIDLLADALSSFVSSGQPGIATLFVYNVWPKEKQAFCQFAERLAKRVFVEPNSGCVLHSITHRGGSRNLVALFHSALKLPSDFVKDAVEQIEDMALVNAMQASTPGYTTREAVMDILEGRSCERHSGAASSGT